MKYTRILKMLLVLALSTSITSCEEFIAIFDDPVETILPTDEELKANALRILAEIQKDGALFSIYYILDGVESVATFKTENGQFVYQEPAANARRAIVYVTRRSNMVRNRFEEMFWDIINTLGEAIAQVQINAGDATYSQVTPVLADGSQASLGIQGIALMKAGTVLKDVPKTMPDAIAALNSVVEGVVFGSKEELQKSLNGQELFNASDILGMMDQVLGDGKVHGTGISFDNAGDGGAGQDMKVGDAEQSDDLTMLAIHYTPQQYESTLNETLTLTNDVREVAKLSSFQKSFYEKMNLETSLARQLRLAVEEAVVNVIEYAYPHGTEGNVGITMMFDGHRLKVVIDDSGVAFDPTAEKKVDTTLSAEERRVGGLGLHLVRELMDSINYERVNGHNILTLRKQINK